jgi:hypothetical protein
MLADGVKLLKSTAGLNWTAAGELDMTKINCQYGNDYRAAHNAIFYGTLGTGSGNVTGFWGFFSFVDPQLGNLGPYYGTRILPVKFSIP